MADYVRGERLRQLRGHASQETVAFEIGVSAKSLRAWEHGGKIRWDNAKRVAAYYNVDPETLVAREMPAPEPEGALPPAQLPLPEQVAQIAHVLSELAEQVRLFQLETLARDLEVRQLLEERLSPKGQSQGQQPQ